MFRSSLCALSVAALCALSVGSPANAATGTVTFAVDAPEVQYTYVTDAVVETFNTDCDTPLEIGSFTGFCGFTAGNFYAGASATTPAPSTGGVSSNFASLSPGTAMTVTLDEPAYYVGFHWEAGNNYDRVQLFNDGQMIANFSFQSLMDALAGSSFVAESGDVYSTANYYGNPVTGQQGHEPYAYVHIFAEGGASFDQVVISEDAGSGGAFEIDNLSVAYTQQEIDTDVYTFDVVSVDLGGGLASTGFDPALAGFSAVALASVGVTALSRRKRSQ